MSTEVAKKFCGLCKSYNTKITEQLNLGKTYVQTVSLYRLRDSATHRAMIALAKLPTSLTGSDDPIIESLNACVTCNYKSTRIIQILERHGY